MNINVLLMAFISGNRFKRSASAMVDQIHGLHTMLAFCDNIFDCRQKLLSVYFNGTQSTTFDTCTVDPLCNNCRHRNEIMVIVCCSPVLYFAL